MAKEQKKEVTKRVSSPVALYELIDDGVTAEGIYQVLKNIERGFLNKGFTSVRFALDSGYDSVDLELILTRLETDKEFERRLEKAAQERTRRKEAKKKKQETERKLYEKLKKKFEK